MSITIYGIKNCSTMKKAFDWLNERGVAYRFHDYKKGGIDAETLQRWCDRAGREALINTRGTTWRKLDEHRRAVATDAETLQRWCDRAGREALINTRGTTWRKLDEHRRAVATDAAAIALMAEHPSLIRRPVVELPDGSLLLGFDPTRFEAALAPSGGGA